MTEETKTTEETKPDESTVTEDEGKTTEESKTVETKSETSENSETKSSENEDKVETTESTEKVKTESETTTEEENALPDRVVPKAEDYTLPEGVPKNLAQFANENDFTQAQLDKTLEHFSGYVQVTKQAEQTLLRESGDDHVKSWGDKRDYNLALVRRALAQNDPEGKLKTMLNTTGYGNHPAVLDFFLSIGNSMKEGGFIQGSLHSPKGKTTAASTMFGKSHPSTN